MEEKTYKIRINLSDGMIEVEGDKDFVKSEIRELLEEIQKYKAKYIHSKKLSQVNEIKEEEIQENKLHIKEFIEEKKPSNSLQTAVVLAYYLWKYEGKETFTVEDLKKIWVASGQKPPKRIRQSIIDAKRHHNWFENVSRGAYKLSPHGIYFVENELPKNGKTS